MLDAAGDAIKALFVMGANPASEKPGWAANLDKLDFLVVQDLFLTETAQLADVVLPAVGWAETGRHLHEPGAARPAGAQGAGQPAEQGRARLDDH